MDAGMTMFLSFSESLFAFDGLNEYESWTKENETAPVKRFRFVLSLAFHDFFLFQFLTLSSVYMIDRLR